MKIVLIYGGSIFSTKYWNKKVLFIKTALLKNKIITIFEKRLHKSLVEIKKVRWSTPLTMGALKSKLSLIIIVALVVVSNNLLVTLVTQKIVVDGPL